MSHQLRPIAGWLGSSHQLRPIAQRTARRQLSRGWLCGRGRMGPHCTSVLALYRNISACLQCLHGLMTSACHWPFVTNDILEVGSCKHCDTDAFACTRTYAPIHNVHLCSAAATDSAYMLCPLLLLPGPPFPLYTRTCTHAHTHAHARTRLPCTSPLQDPKRQRRLAHISFLRQVELVEWNSTGAAYTEATPRCIRLPG